jgi:hypothetical protein
MRTSCWYNYSFSDSLTNSKRHNSMYSFELRKPSRSKIILLTVNGIIFMRMVKSMPDIFPDFRHIRDLEYMPQSSSSRRHAMNHYIDSITEVTMQSGRAGISIQLF